MSTTISNNGRRTRSALLLVAAGTFACLGVSAVHASTNPIASNAASSYGVMVLDSGDTAGALTLSGNARARAPIFYVNSSSKSAAISGSGNSIIDAPILNLVGGANFNGSATCTGVIANFPNAVVDPFANLSAPAADPAHDLGAIAVKKGAVTLNPGYYSGGISISSNAVVTLNPGTYVVAGGLSVTGGSLTGTGVTIVVLSGHISMTSNAVETLSAPTTGTWAGIVLAQPASNTSSLSLSGGNTMTLAGTIWAPAAAASISGNSSATETGPQMGDSLIVKTLTISGTGQLRIGQPQSVIVPPQVNDLND